MDGILVLANGHSFRGRLRGACQPCSGEVIFNTAMTGYQEILTDPSYCGQIITMTYPHIGNYGVNKKDIEGRAPFAAGMVVKELSRVVSNWRASGSLEDYLRAEGITVLEGVDTRALVTSLREQGALSGLIRPFSAEKTESAQLTALQQEAAALPGMEGQNLVRQVSVDRPYTWPCTRGENGQEVRWSHATFRVIAYDYGIKHNILRHLSARGVTVEVVPYDFPAEQALALRPDGVFLSNGPGDPQAVREAVEIVEHLLGKLPIFGICLGHQIMALALGAETCKLLFGHHGANHPVIDLDTGKVEITSQNHGFAVTEASLPETVRITHRNLNDQTVEGLESLLYPAFSVQYHPEASPGPHDSHYLFERFIALMKKQRRQHSA